MTKGQKWNSIVWVFEVQYNLPISWLTVRSFPKQQGIGEIYNSGIIISFPVLFPVNSSCHKWLIMTYFLQAIEEAEVRINAVELNLIPKCSYKIWTKEGRRYFIKNKRTKKKNLGKKIMHTFEYMKKWFIFNKICINMLVTLMLWLTGVSVIFVGESFSYTECSAYFTDSVLYMNVFETFL